MHPAQCHVLADAGDGFGQNLFHRLAVQMGRPQNLDILAGLQGNLGHLGHQCLEVGVLGNKVGFRVDFNGNAAAIADGNPDKTLCRHAVGLLGGLGQAFGAQPVNGGFHVAVGFRQRPLCVHHACAGRLAQFLHHLGGDCHSGSP